MKKLTYKKPWGKFIQFTHDQKSTIKILEVNPGEMLSLQSHQKRDEFWYIFEGNPTIVLNTKVKQHKQGNSIQIKKNTKHRIMNKTKKIVRILEISTGHFDENDITRYEDKYHRVKTNN